MALADMKQWLLERWREYRHSPVSMARLVELEAWLQTPLGVELLAAEQQAVDKALSCLFGYHLMSLSIDRQADLSRASRIQHCFSLSPRALQGQQSAAADFEALPLPAESVDVSVLHHVLEFAEHPHQLLREAERITVPHGHLVIVAFNPISLFGACRAISRSCNRRSLWHYHSLRLGRLLDWLHLLDLTPVDVQRGFYRPPIQSAAMMQRLERVESWGRAGIGLGGAFYVVTARKEVSAMTPIRPAWQGLKPVSGLGIAKPSNRKSHGSVLELEP